LKDYEAATIVDIVSLVNFSTVIFESSFVVSKTINDLKITTKQLTHLKNYFQLLFVT